MKKIILISIVTLLMLSSCSIYNTIANFSKLKFKLDSVNDYKIAGVPVSEKSQLKDFTALQILKLSSEFASGNLPVSFKLNVEVKNPNEAKNSGGVDITLKEFPWTLYIDDNETISGTIGSPVVIPGGIKTEIIPLEIRLDLMKFFSNKNFDSLLNLALKLSGNESASSNIKLVASPTLGTPIGDMTYPEPLTIVNHTFN
ncbi:MAG: hypothetical protein HND52_16810 [Ignavibacteriae bacterium]|nr:hypothetical protein [Ignavibacteriota bacterium]NOG99621.1 hypothetical protein [Ignavibacteriota bacterium]